MEDTSNDVFSGYPDGYNEPQVEVDESSIFNIEHYKSHFVPRREVIELKKAKDE